MWIIVPFIKGCPVGEKASSNEPPRADDQAPESGSPPEPRLRADARRNEDAILQAAAVVFARSGVDAPIREIASQAGVGLGTIYRRFATRADLVAAVFRSEVDACARSAEHFGANLPPDEALRAWLMRYTQFLGTKRGLAAALHSGDPAFASLPDYFRSRFEPALARLLTAAADAGAIRAGIESYDLLRAIGNLAAATGPGSDEHVTRMIALLLDGLRYGAGADRQ